MSNNLSKGGEQVCGKKILVIFVFWSEFGMYLGIVSFPHGGIFTQTTVQVTILGTLAFWKFHLKHFASSMFYLKHFESSMFYLRQLVCVPMSNFYYILT